MHETDSQLLGRFAAERSDSAFEALVGRHGRMVLGVCQRVLGDPHDAEDAFQATFLVLARSSAKLRKTGSVASWLHGTALRVSLNARRQAARRKERERRAAEMITTDREQAWQELRPVLDEELERMPAKLRAPVALCYLEHRTNEEAARELGWTEGAVRGRLAKGREVLRKRLARRGIAIGGALLVATISENALAVTVPQACVASTVNAAIAASAAGALAGGAVSGKAAALAAEAVKAMAWAKVKVAACVVAAGATVGGGAALVAREALTVEKDAIVVGAEGEAGAAVVARRPRRPASDLAGGGRKPGDVAPAPAGEPVVGGPIARKAEAKLRARDLPEAVLRSIMARYPGAVIEKVKRKTKRQRTVYDVDLELDGGARDCEVHLEPDGRVVESKEELDAARLPAAVAGAIDRLHPGATVKDASMETQGDLTTFDVELEFDDDEFDIKLTPDGQVINDEEAEGQDGDEEGNEEEVDGAGERGGSKEGDNVRPAAGAGPEVF